MAYQQIDKEALLEDIQKFLLNPDEWEALNEDSYQNPTTLEQIVPLDEAEAATNEIIEILNYSIILFEQTLKPRLEAKYENSDKFKSDLEGLNFLHVIAQLESNNICISMPTNRKVMPDEEETFAIQQFRELIDPLSEEPVTFICITQISEQENQENTVVIDNRNLKSVISVRVKDGYISLEYKPGDCTYNLTIEIPEITLNNILDLISRIKVEYRVTTLNNQTTIYSL